MDFFANIGKAVLLQSIGLQKNYTEMEESTIEMIDYNNTACSDCKYKAFIQAFEPGTEAYQTACETCQNCPKKIFTTKTVYKKIYHNEKNRYAHTSYKPRLKTNAIKLLLVLHFYHPDRFGIIKNLDICELAELLKCDIKTIWNNLAVLNKYSYITYSKVDTYKITLCLNDYDSYYLPAKKGGRGFFVLSKELLMELLQINTLVTLRIYLRELINIDNLNIKGGPFTTDSRTYKEIKRSLPEYCKPHIIKKAVQNHDHIFHITCNDCSVRFEIKEEFNAKRQKTACYNFYIQKFNDFILDFNNTVSFLNINNITPPKYTYFFDEVCSSGTYHLLCFREFEIEDLAMLALQYSYDSVIFALSSIYKTYFLKDKKVMNLGGLVRTAITAQLNHSDEAA